MDIFPYTDDIHSGVSGRVETVCLLVRRNGLHIDIDVDAQEEKKIRKARRKAVTDYVNRKIQDVAGRKEQLAKDLHIFDGADVEEQIAQATAALQETQRKIDRALAESQKILTSILDAEERAAECDVLLTRYHRCFRYIDHIIPIGQKH